MSESKSALLTLVVDVERDIPEQGDRDYWQWLFAYKHDISVRSVTGGRPAQGNQVCGENEWCREHFSGGEIFHLVEEELPLKAGRYLVTGRMWGSRDYWGEYDEGFDPESFKRSPGNCKQFWRRRAHERKAAYQSWAPPSFASLTPTVYTTVSNCQPGISSYTPEISPLAAR